jgi:hypothetical protein
MAPPKRACVGGAGATGVGRSYIVVFEVFEELPPQAAIYAMHKTMKTNITNFRIAISPLIFSLVFQNINHQINTLFPFLNWL